MKHVQKEVHFTQGYKGINNDKYIDINPNDDAQSYPFCRLWLVVETFGHSAQWTDLKKAIKVFKFLIQRIRKPLYKTLGTSVIMKP